MPTSIKTLNFETIDSTNLEAQRLVANGEHGPLWLRADEQIKGKGRLGRHWVSKPGNLYSTLIWPTSAPQITYSQLSFVAALAVAEASSHFTSSGSITLKWPNDCLLNGAKFCGILCEVLKPGTIAIGIGINIAHVPDGLPYSAQRLGNATIKVLFEKLQVSASKYLKIWNEGEGFEEIRCQWMKQCAHIGKQVKVDQTIGTFESLGADGALQLRLPNHVLKDFYAGDVTVEYKQAQ